MGINFKEKFQNINKKVVAAIILILLIAVVCGLFAFKHVNDKKKAAEAQRIQAMEQQAKEAFRQRQQPENAEQPKKPSEYAVGIDYNKAMTTSTSTLEAARCLALQESQDPDKRNFAKPSQA